MAYYDSEYKTVLRYYENRGNVQKINTEGEVQQIQGHAKKVVDRLLNTGITNKWV